MGVATFFVVKLFGMHLKPLSKICYMMLKSREVPGRISEGLKKFDLRASFLLSEAILEASRPIWCSNDHLEPIPDHPGPSELFSRV